jgi:folate-binding Fe-S cluster repair protein YgfZ
MRYANVCDHLHHRQAMQQYAELPSESLDRIRGSDMVYWLQTLLTF